MLVSLLRKMFGVKEPEGESLIDLWIWALTGAGYTQGKKRLRNLDDKFCVLGVLCDLSGAGKWRKYEFKDSYQYTMDNALLSSRVFPPWEVARLISLETTKTVYEVEDFFHKLAALNDGGKTFASLADKIEKELK